MASENELRQVRIDKMNALRDQGVQVYPEKFTRTHTPDQVKDLKPEEKTSIAGRLVSLRKMGRLAFGRIQDEHGQAQVVFNREELGDNFQIVKSADVGDFLGIHGSQFTTKTGESSVLAGEVIFLGKALLPLPEKFHGLTDEEALDRQRYLDLISNPETMERFLFRSKFIRAIREFYWKENFHEVETPTLWHTATGAAAKPYVTHNNGLDIDVFLRISPELPLKELIVGGFDKIFELGKAFRNEGIDPSHLPEHTHLEHYCAYWNYEDNINFTEKLFDYLFDTLGLERKREVIGKDGKPQTVDFTTPWKRENYVELIKKESGIDVLAYDDADKLRSDIKAKDIKFEKMDDMGLTTLIDNLYKKVVRPKLINPVVLYGYPKIVQPLARTNDNDPRLVDQFQVVVNGWEIVKAYSELVDPIDQAERFKEQATASAEGDEEAYEGDDEFITALEHGAPPISGWGMGVDRVLTLLTGKPNLRDLVLFPLMRPKGK